ncbi:uncharacterized protein LOC108623442 isoform X2 [Ceratina calcarata]|nr:uncharacterized protein LOC108623442 isoform X2 [Ceratina calcarata]
MTSIERVHFSIQAQQRAIKYVQEIENTHTTYLFLCIGIVICGFSVTLVQLTTMEVNMDFYKVLSFLIAQLMHLFYLTIQGQFVENVCDTLYRNIYEGLWYNTNAKTQLLYVLALRRMLIPPRLTAGGLINMNMESFSEVKCDTTCTKWIVFS